MLVTAGGRAGLYCSCWITIVSPTTNSRGINLQRISVSVLHASVHSLRLRTHVMALSWFSRRPVGDSSVAIISVNLSPSPEVPESPTSGGHLRLHSRARSDPVMRGSVYEGRVRLTTSFTEVEGDSTGKHKPALLPAREAVGVFVRHNWISVIYSAVSLCVMVLMVYLSYFAAEMEDGTTPEFLTCRSWAFGTECGLWGINCRPFESEWTAIRCRSRCTLDQGSSMAVWGTGKYHANSRICRAAVHAGVIGPNGGCARMRYSGAANAFYGSTANGVSSSNYASWFPKTFEFQAAPSSYCSDLTWPILAVAVAICFGFALLPRTNAGMLYGILVGSGFFFVRIVGQPPSVDYAGIAINAFGEVLVLLAASYWLYSIAPAYTFAHWSSLPLRSRVVMWGLCYVLPFYVFINMNMFAYLPWLSIGLGGYEATHTNAGTYIVIVIVVIFILFCAFRFLRQLYRLRLWRRYIVWYAVVVVSVLLSWALFSSTDFHLHHSMFGVMLIPLTRFPTPLAAIAQSTLLGVFVQGYTAWGWSSYLDRMPTYLTIEKPEAPVALTVTQTQANISWTALEGMDGYSLRLNKVEVYRGTHNYTVIDGLQPNFTYFITVAGVAAWGTDGQEGPKANFTTLA